MGQVSWTPIGQEPMPQDGESKVDFQDAPSAKPAKEVFDNCPPKDVSIADQFGKGK